MWTCSLDGRLLESPCRFPPRLVPWLELPAPELEGASNWLIIVLLESYSSGCIFLRCVAGEWGRKYFRKYCVHCTGESTQKIPWPKQQSLLCAASMKPIQIAKAMHNWHHLVWQAIVHQCCCTNGSSGQWDGLLSLVLSPSDTTVLPFHNSLAREATSQKHLYSTHIIKALNHGMTVPLPWMFVQTI